MAEDTECTVAFFCLETSERGAAFFFGHVSEDHVRKALRFRYAVLHISVIHSDFHPSGELSRIWRLPFGVVLGSTVVKARAEKAATDFLNGIFRRIPVWFYSSTIEAVEKRLTG